MNTSPTEINLDFTHLSHKQPWRWIFHVVLEWLCIILAFVCIATFQKWWVFGIAIVVIGSRQHALSILAHEGTHWLITNNIKLNDTLTRLLCAWPIFASLSSYRAFHFLHHQFLGTNQDPELQQKRLAAPYWNLPFSRLGFFTNIFLDITGIGLFWKERRVLLQVLTSFHVHKNFSRGFHWDTLLLAYWGCIIFIFWHLHALWILSVWAFTLITVFFTIFQMRVLTEHLGIPDTYRFYARWFERLLFLPHNTWHHFEHHLYPSVPEYHLPEIRKTLPHPPLLNTHDIFTAFFTFPPVASGDILTTPSSESAEQHTEQP